MAAVPLSTIRTSRPSSCLGTPVIGPISAAILILFLALPFTGLSQSVSEKENQFVKLVQLGESAPAHALLNDLLLEDSTGIYMLTKEVEQLILPGDIQIETPPAKDILKLSLVYDMGARHDPAGPSPWLVRQALLANRYPATFPGKQGLILKKAVASDPHACPLFLFERWAEWEIQIWKASKKFKSGQSPVGEGTILSAWQTISNGLNSRQLTLQTGDAEDAGRLQQRLALQLRNVFPDCASIVKSSTQISDPIACIEFLTLYDLQNCNVDESTWEQVFNCATSVSAEAWMFRLAAIRNMAQNDYRAALQSWSRAKSLELYPYHKASDALRIAEVHTKLGEFALAREEIKKAMAYNVYSGDPYFQMCDLYLEAPEKCNFSAFDRKAIYWVLIDLCQVAKNKGAASEAEATDRIYRYKQLGPTPAEAAFKGLKSGDTWPIGCWIRTVTTAKFD